MPSGVWPSPSPALPPISRGCCGGSPGGTRRATCPRPLRQAAVADSAASLGAPVAEPSPPPAVSAYPLKGSFARPVPWHPVSGTLALSPPPSTSGLLVVVVGGHRWSRQRQCHRGASLFLGLELGTHSSTVPWLGSGWGCGERAVRGPELSLTRICLSSAPRCVPDPSARLARSLRPGECRQRRRPVLGAPGHAAAAAAELGAAVAPPVRQPEMPRPL